METYAMPFRVATLHTGAPLSSATSPRIDSEWRTMAGVRPRVPHTSPAPLAPPTKRASVPTVAKHAAVKTPQIVRDTLMRFDTATIMGCHPADRDFTLDL